MSEYRKAKPEEREACIEFADYVSVKRTVRMISKR